MDIKIVIDEKLLNQIFQLESVKLVGKCLKRFELTDDKELIKKEIKELLYEGLRDIRDMLSIYGKDSIRLSPCKEGEKDVK
jgi:hypothetical protein